MKMVILLFACMTLLHSTKVGAMNNHQHAHDTAVQHPRPNNGRIKIQRMVNGARVPWHLLRGDLVLDSRECSRIYGHAAVQFRDGPMFYACLEPDTNHDENMNMMQNRGYQEFLAVVERLNQPRLEAHLIPDNLPHDQLMTALNLSQDMRFRRPPVGHVRYIKSPEINVDGDLFEIMTRH